MPAFGRDFHPHKPSTLTTFEPWMENVLQGGKRTTGWPAVLPDPRQDTNFRASEVGWQIPQGTNSSASPQTATSEQFTGRELLAVLQKYLCQLTSAQPGNPAGHRGHLCSNASSFRSGMYVFSKQSSFLLGLARQVSNQQQNIDTRGKKN